MSLIEAVYLRTCIGVDFDLGLVDHFVEHYHSLGIKEFRIILHSQTDGGERLKAAKEKLRGCDIKCEIHEWLNEKWTVEKYRNLLNELIQDLDEQTWVLTAEADELQEFPGGLQALLDECNRQNMTHVRGRLMDRLPRDGNLKPIARTPSLWEQCPIKKRMTKGVCCNDKVVLHKKCVKLISGNHYVDESEVAEDLKLKAHSLIVDVHHFKWFANIEEKLDSYEGRDAYFSQEKSKYKSVIADNFG